MTQELLRRLAVLTLAGVIAFSAADARAQDAAILQREEDDEQRLRRWMAVRAARSPDTNWLAAVTIPGGVAVMGAGIGLAAWQEELGSNALSVAAATMMALGVVNIALGIYTALAPNLARDDYREVPESRLSEREIGRLEGILRHEARLSELARTMATWLGGGMAVGGLVAMPVMAAYPPENAFELGLGWGLSGGMVLLGLVTFVAALFESPSEADWREYQRGLMPREAPTISVVPTGNGLLVAF